MKMTLITYAPQITINGTKKNHSIKFILDPFIKAFERKNSNQNQIEFLNLDNMVINECLGCSNDLFFIPQEYCRQTDDMNSIYDILRNSDLWFFAIESNSHRPPKKLLNFLDRLEPLFDEDFINYENRKNSQKSKQSIFFVGISSLWESSVFDEVSFQIQSIAILFNREIKGQILRPHYGAFIQECNNNSEFRNTILKKIDEIADGLLCSKPIDESSFQLLNSPVIEREEYAKKFSDVLSII
ncbi:MAG TPA: hypothetical protein PKV40_00365 [Candidatus Kapabacteria bacterium]|nr:hypothetical protein [Candidatus Kapabacteria bacterium]